MRYLQAGGLLLARRSQRLRRAGGATDPAEIRAVNSENIARDQEQIDMRTKYGGVEIKF